MQTEVTILHGSPEALAGTLDRMLSGIVVADAAGRVLYRNATANAMLGPSCTNVRSILRRVEEDAWTEVEIAPLRFVEASVVRVPWDGGSASLLTLNDVTERRRRQASLTVLAQELRSENAHLQMLADVDSLTGLLNRRGLKRVLDAQVLPRVHLGFDLVAVMVDCDEFKAVNDTFGHVAGDHVLRQVGERLRSALRPGDPLARVGGDEFLILLPGARQADALRIANRIRQVVAQTPMAIPYRSSEIALTVSVGVAQIPRHVRDTEEIVKRADARLRQSKISGKNRVTGPCSAPSSLEAVAE